MNRLALLIAAALLSSNALAHQGNTKQECSRRCLASEMDNPTMAKHRQKLKQIREQKVAETDAEKRKLLEQAETEQIERSQDDQEKMCRQICAPLRDE